GYLFLGHAETPRGAPVSYRLCRAPGCLYYQLEPRDGRASPGVSAPAPTVGLPPAGGPTPARAATATAGSVAPAAAPGRTASTARAEVGAPIAPGGATSLAADAAWPFTATAATPAPADASSGATGAGSARGGLGAPLG